MRILEMGSLANLHWETKGLPKHGIVIEATKEELKELAKRVPLYSEVYVRTEIGANKIQLNWCRRKGDDNTIDK